MGGIFKSLDLSNPERRFDIYYHLPEKQERAISTKQAGHKHVQGKDVEGMFQKAWAYFGMEDDYE